MKDKMKNIEDEKIINIKIKKPKNLEPKTIINGILTILVLVSGIQTYELINLKKELEGPSIKPVQAQQSTTPTILPDSLNNLPDMVGGC